MSQVSAGQLERRWHAARAVFGAAGVYGFVVLLPLYGMERTIAAGGPPLSHPEYYYGFVGTALAANVLFLLVARDPLRLHAAMLVGVVEKLAFALPVAALWWLGRTDGVALLFGLIDLVWGMLFLLSWLALRPLDVDAGPDDAAVVERGP